MGFSSEKGSSAMDAVARLSPRARDLHAKMRGFVEDECIPAESLYEAQLGEGAQRWASQPAVMEHLKSRAKKLGLWNLFLPQVFPQGAGLTNLEYACLAELTGRSPLIAPEATNCAAPDTGNMEVLAKYGTPAQQERWLAPLLRGETRSAFAMTDKNVASSDAANIHTKVELHGDHYVINGHKWYISGAGHPNLAFYLVLAKHVRVDTNQSRHEPQNQRGAHRYSQHSLVLVPADTPGIRKLRPLHVFGYDDANHGHYEIVFENVRVPVRGVAGEGALILGEGRGFEVIQGRLGPGRIHHCMRALGMAERALDETLVRVTERGEVFGKPMHLHAGVFTKFAEARIRLNQARLLTWAAAADMDRAGALAVESGKPGTALDHRARMSIGLIKVQVPRAALAVVDECIQLHGATGVSQDTVLARFYAGLRTLRIADGPDEVHLLQIGRLELQRAAEVRANAERQRARARKLGQAVGGKSKL